MKVKVASSRGFCFGVEDAIEIAEAALERRGPGGVVALGPVIHNKEVVQLLETAGLDQSGELDTIDPASAVLIRSHGAEPETFLKAKQRGLDVVDATCVVRVGGQCPCIRLSWRHPATRYRPPNRDSVHAQTSHQGLHG